MSLSIAGMTSPWAAISIQVRLKQRLKDAIANSRAITNLADNPLLLTMMAISESTAGTTPRSR
jgi:predicted NACHT family NTPase